MARPKKNGEKQPHELTEMDRTTVLLPKVMNANIDCLSLRTGESKAVIFRRAVANYLKEEGLDPYRQPQVNISYSNSV